MRTCAGCGARDRRMSMLRVAVVDCRVVVDERQTLPGRGAWVHPALTCIDQAKRRRAIPRILKVQQVVDLSDDELWDELTRVALSVAQTVPEHDE